VRIVSTTLAGPHSAAVIGDALRSVVDWVDGCLVIEAGGGATATEAARVVAGDKLVERAFTWRDDFAAARNAALDLAAELGATWAVTVDVDERLEPRGEDLRAALAGAAFSVVAMLAADGSYSKPRAIRVPAAARWVGATHEALPTNSIAFFASARFSELSKPAADLQLKFARDAELLRREIARDPSDPRWHFYLGASLHGLGQLEEAIEAFRACARLRGWREESAWACCRAAELLVELQRYDEAVEACAAGLARHAGIAELAWVAAVASYRAGRPDQASYWASLAEVHGELGEGQALKSRLAFRNRVGLREGPSDVLRHALRALGDTDGARVAERRFWRLQGIGEVHFNA
jgi:tetratricopeptide (TPR) repeat protein